MHGVLNEGHHVAHLQVAGGDLLAAEPHDEQGQAIHHQGHGGHHGGHGPVDEEGVGGEVVISLFKAVLHEFLIGEGTHHHQAADLLAADQVEAVHQGLHLLKAGHGHGKEHQQQAQHDDEGQSQHPGQVDAGGQAHDEAANAHDGGKAQQPQTHTQEVLHLGDVVGGTGDEGGPGETVHLIVVEVGDLGEHIPAQVPSDPGAHPGHAVASGHGAQGEQHRQHGHTSTSGENVVGLNGVGVSAQLLIEGLDHGHTCLLQHGVRGLSRHVNGLLDERLSLGLGQHLAQGLESLGHGGLVALAGARGLAHDLGQGVAGPAKGGLHGLGVLGVQSQVGVCGLGKGGRQVLIVRVVCQRHVGSLHHIPVLLGHELLHEAKGVGGDHLGSGGGDASLLQAHIDDVAHVVGQGQLQHGLAKEKHNAHQQQNGIGFQITLEFQHKIWFPPRSYGLPWENSSCTARARQWKAWMSSWALTPSWVSSRWSTRSNFPNISEPVVWSSSLPALVR